MRRTRLGFRNVSVIVAILIFLGACGQVGVEDPGGPVQEDPITDGPNQDDPTDDPADDPSEEPTEEPEGDEPDGSEPEGSEPEGSEPDSDEGALPADEPEDGETVSTIDWAEAVIGYDDALEILKSSDEEVVREAEGDVVVSAFGRDIWHDADEFFFVYTTLSGDGSLQARLSELDAAHEWTKAGIMIREDLRPEARNVLVHVSGSNGSVLQARETAGATTSAGAYDPDVEAPYWLRLTREGDRITGELSADGESWRTLGTYTVPFDRDVHIGFAVTANSDGAVATGRFSEIRLIERSVDEVPDVSEPEPPSSWVCPDRPLSPAYEPTHFVAPDGNDANDGTDPTRAFRTLARAADAVAPGDVVWVRDGVYSSDVRIRRSGTADAPIVFESHPGECAILDGEAFGLSYGQNVRFEDARHVVFRNFVVRNSPSQGIFLIDSHDNRVSHVRVHDNSMSGIQNVRGDRNQFSHFIAHDNYDAHNGGIHADGIGLSSGRDNRIEQCVTYRNSDDGIDTWRSVDTVVDRCVSFENGFHNGDGIGIKAGGGIDNYTLVRDSIAFDNRGVGLSNNSGRHVTFVNNTSFQNGRAQYIGHESVTFRNNIAAGGGLYVVDSSGGTNSWNLGIYDPRFVSTDPTDPAFLSLSTDSPAIDAGTDAGYAYDGAAPDLGAIPFGRTLADVIGISLRDVLDH